MRGAWIEISLMGGVYNMATSRPVRGAWIEMAVRGIKIRRSRVAPREGRVD